MQLALLAFSSVPR